MPRELPRKAQIGKGRCTAACCCFRVFELVELSEEQLASLGPEATSTGTTPRAPIAGMEL